MDAPTLTDRYVYAAMRSVPETQRTDLGTELRASIDDQVDARIDSGMLREDAERQVLTELGDPDKLAAGYTDRPMYLLGPRYFFVWWRLLKLLLWIVLPLVAIGVTVAGAIQENPFGQIVGSIVTATLMATVHLGFWTVLVFVLVDRFTPTGGKDAGEWTLNQLPAVPAPGGVGLGDLISSAVIFVLTAGVLIWDRTIGFVPEFDGLTLLNPELWPWWIGGLLVIMGLDVSIRWIVYLRRRWTIGFAVVETVLALIVGVTAVGLAATIGLVNPEFFPTVIAAGGGEGADEVGPIVNIVFAVLSAGIAGLYIVDLWLRVRRDHRRGC